MEVDFKDAILGSEKELTLPTGRRIQVKIPAGLKSGQKLRMKGQGGPGMGQGPAGDLYIEIQVRSSELFSRVGNNIETEIDVPLEKAVLGGKVVVPTLEGRVELTIPPHTNSGTKLRVRGKGVKGKGDLMAKVKIVLPPTDDKSLDEAIKQWQKTRKRSDAHAA